MVIPSLIKSFFDQVKKELLGNYNIVEADDNYSDFLKAFDITMKFEGGYVNNPKDPGGETKFGISKKSYPKVSIKDLTIDDARKIYHSDYWIPSGAEELPWPSNLVQFDCAVNCGVGTANKFIKEVGSDALTLIERRESYYNRLVANKPGLKVFLKGWMSRTGKLKEIINSLP